MGAKPSQAAPELIRVGYEAMSPKAVQREARVDAKIDRAIEVLQRVKARHSLRG